MKLLVISASLVFSMVAVGSTSAHKYHHPKRGTAAADEGFKLIHADALEKQLAKPGTFVFDANTDETREKEGVIPGAKILTSSTQFDVAATLPPNKDASVVFYCANEACMASHEAAKLAVKNGYTHVSVMSDGIKGWKKAGKKTEKFTKTS
jgi:rhodanese-related sulfurtransferase